MAMQMQDDAQGDEGVPEPGDEGAAPPLLENGSQTGSWLTLSEWFRFLKPEKYSMP